MQPADRPEGRRGRVGLLLVNLGTPDTPDRGAVRRYLAEFLSDRRVVEIPPLLWQPILRGLILNSRPAKSARLYRSIWKEDSPLRAITRRQADDLGKRLGDGLMVDWAMRYGRPNIRERLAALADGGCDRILLAPLYPQYSAATTASALDAAFAALAERRSVPALRTLPPYYDQPAYLDALAGSIGDQVGALDFEPEVLLLSFHGMPKRTLTLGDPYYHHCLETARLLSARLRLGPERLRLTFQSRFGRAEWLRPYTDETLAALPREGVRRVAVAAPGFAADCLETLEELGIRGRETFLAAGGDRIARLDCLNDGARGMYALEQIVRQELAGWLDRPPNEADT